MVAWHEKSSSRQTGECKIWNEQPHQETWEAIHGMRKRSQKDQSSNHSRAERNCCQLIYFIGKLFESFPWLLTHLQMGPHHLWDDHHLSLWHPLVDLLNEDPRPDSLSHRPQSGSRLFTFDCLKFFSSGSFSRKISFKSSATCSGLAKVAASHFRTFLDGNIYTHKK